MARTYKKKLGARPYRNYDEATVKQAVQDIRDGKFSIREAANCYKIPRKTLGNKVKDKHVQHPVGGKIQLGDKQEGDIIRHILACADWGMPLDSFDIRFIVKEYLTAIGQTVKKFRNNMPGESWFKAFVRRHKSALTIRKCQNVKRARASVGVAEIGPYFDHLERSLDGIPPSNILNYDETNCSDDPGSKKMVFRRGVKYPERYINSTKGCISLMFAAAADGTLLPVYVVYKAEHLWKTWVEGGPPGTRYGRTKSGWFDGSQFEEWFLTVVVPWAQKLDGPKCMIGDNLSSHISINVINECEKHDIRFVLLHANATHLCQPLDVAFFAPLKKEWRELLTTYKTQNPSSTSLEKSMFPRLLKKLLENIGVRTPLNIIAGFKACGIAPVDRQQVLKRIPEARNQEQIEDELNGSVLSDTLLNYLKSCRRGGDLQKTTTRNKKLKVLPGKSVSSDDLQLGATTATGTAASDDNTAHVGQDKPTTSRAKQTRRKRKSADETDDDEDAMSLHDSTSSDSLSDFTDEAENLCADTSDEEVPMSPSNLDEPEPNREVPVPTKDQYVLAKFLTKKTAKYYVAKVTEVYSATEFEVSCLRATSKHSDTFVYPDQHDVTDVDLSQIVMVLPTPNSRRGRISFDIDLYFDIQ